MVKIPDFIICGSATLVSTWIQLKKNGMGNYLKMVEFCGANKIKPPLCMVLLCANLMAKENDGGCEAYCKEACYVFLLCNNVKQLEMVCKIYSAQITDNRSCHHELDVRLHTIAKACLNKKIPRKVRDFVVAPTADAVDATYRAAALSLGQP